MPGSQYTLKIEDETRVESSGGPTYTGTTNGILKLNGVQLFGPTDFGPNVVRSKTVSLQATNTLEISYQSHDISHVIATVDGDGRLREVKRDGAVVALYDYDANGNRLQFTGTGGAAASATYDAQDRMTSYGGASYAYAANGELERRVAGADTTRYRYDALGNLLGVTLPGGRTIDYVVDAAGRRIGRKVNGALVQGFLYSGPLAPAAELDGQGQVVSRFVHGLRPNAPDYLVRGGVTYQLVTDHLGSVRLVVNAATGAVAQEVDYDAFGRVTRNTSPGFQPFGFAGGLYDEDTKLVRFGARDYDAESGRWTAKDPVGFGGGDANLYAYVGGDPVNLVDPDGLRPCPPEISALEPRRSRGGVLGPMLAALGRTVENFVRPRNEYVKSGRLLEDLVYSFAPAATRVNVGGTSATPRLSSTKAALAKVHERVGRLPKGEPGKFNSPQRGTTEKGYRLDPGHPRAPAGHPESGPHINWWDYTVFKRSSGREVDGAIPIRP